MDAALPNFHERFYTHTYQPYVEYQWHTTRKLTLTPGFKYARYDQDFTQYADNGKTVGNLGGLPSVSHSAGYNSYLPSFDASYRCGIIGRSMVSSLPAPRFRQRVFST